MPHPEDLADTARLVFVFGTASIPEGLLVKGMLEADGIPVQIKGESEGPYRMGPVFLWVPTGFEVQARLLLEEAAKREATADEDDVSPWDAEPSEDRDSS
jgi:hypothetical protein